jgi:hypothetical protein
MIEGILLVNLDPPYIGFSEASQGSQKADSRVDVWRHCSVAEIKELLIDLEAILPDQPWPPRECVLRLQVSWSKEELTRLCLLNLCVLESLPLDEEPVLRRIS